MLLAGLWLCVLFSLLAWPSHFSWRLFFGFVWFDFVWTSTMKIFLVLFFEHGFTLHFSISL